MRAMDLTRRRLLGALGTVPTAVAGCVGCAAPEYEVRLRPAESTAITAADGEWAIDGAVTATFHLENEQTIADVRVVVFDETGDRLVEHDLGDVRGEAATDTGGRCGGRRLDVDLAVTTTAYPHRIELETPTDVACTDDVRFEVAELRPEYETGQTGPLGEYWRYEERRCGETPTETGRASPVASDRETTRTTAGR